MTSEVIGRIALVWRGDIETRRQATPGNNRWRDIFAALAALNIDAEPAVYCEEAADEVREQLLKVDGVLVWVDPLSGGRNRRKLDALLRDVATRGVWVSTIGRDAKNGRQGRALRDAASGLGHRHASLSQRRGISRSVPGATASGRPAGDEAEPWQWRPRRLEGRGVDNRRCAQVLHARRGSEPERSLSAFPRRCDAYFADGGCIVDQPFQAQLPEGMIRCYMGADRVVGFGHQLIKALLPPPPEVRELRPKRSLVRASCIPHRHPPFSRCGGRWRASGRRR